jgi:DNA polymerase-3 subunit gamma/tau
MSYLVLARKWRPQDFDEVVGQRHVTQTLKNAILSKRVAHAFIFSGPRGVGKTTTARILAKAMNCEEGPTPEPCGKCFSCKEIADGNSVDVIEIDGASNTSVEDVRELRENVKYAPSRGRAKIYIIDEVHMLSTSAFNALLKTLEEPPLHVIFIFATTEPHKIPATILSRCQHFEFRRVPHQEILDRLRRITKEEEISISEKGLSIIGWAAEGSLRDALSLLDQVVAFGGQEIKEEDLIMILGVADQGTLRAFSQAILSKDPGKTILLLEDLVEKGQDIRQFLKDLTGHLRNLIMVKIAERPEALIDLPKEDINEMKQEVADVTLEHLELLLNLFLRLEGDIRVSTSPRFLLEMALVKAAQIKGFESLNRILERIAGLEKGLEGTSEIPSDSEIKVSEKIEPQISETPSEEVSGRSAIDAKNLWIDIVDSIKKRNHPLGSKLEQATLMGFTQDELTIGFNGGATIFIDSVKKATKKITEAVENICQREVKVNILAIGGNNLTKERVVKKNLREEALKDPILRKSLDIFDGRLVEVKPVEEIIEKDGG